MSNESDKQLSKVLKQLMASQQRGTKFKLDDSSGDIDFSSPDNLIEAIEIFRDANEFEFSLQCSEKLSKVKPESPVGFQRLIQDYMILDRETEALNVALLAFKRFPEDTGILLLTNDVYRSRSQPEEALKYSSRLLDKHPNLPAGYFCSAQNLVDLGRTSEAKRLIQNLITSIDTPLSKNLARDFYREIGSRNKAKKISKKMAEDSPSFETNIQFAKDLLALGNIERFFRFAKKKRIINDQTHMEYFDDILSEEFAMNLSKPLKPSWRSLSLQYKVFEHFNDSSFNKYPSEIELDNNQLPWLCVIHVGKCAGETVVRSLKSSLPELRHRIIEYHLFDSNILIKQLIELSQRKPNVELIFCTRDPVQRWLSSFNWDFHTYKISKHYYCPRYILDLFDIYKNSKMLARGICKGEKQALTLAKAKHLIFGHMAMGQSWYLPKHLVGSIQETQMHIIRTEKIRKDINHCLHKLSNKYENLIDPMHNINIPVLKNSKYFRGNHSFTLIDHLSSMEVSALLEHLSADVEVHQIMIDRFARN